MATAGKKQAIADAQERRAEAWAVIGSFCVTASLAADSLMAKDRLDAPLPVTVFVLILAGVLFQFLGLVWGLERCHTSSGRRALLILAMCWTSIYFYSLLAPQMSGRG